MTREEKWKQDEAAIEQLVRAHDGVVKTAELYTLGIDYRRIQQFGLGSPGADQKRLLYIAGA